MKAGSLLASLLLGWVVASTALASDTVEAHSFDYLYIVANEGGSSGGHTAIRFGRDVYHFQNEDDLLVVQRDRADDFLHDYALLGNRTVHATRVIVSREFRSDLLDRFRTRHQAQEAQLGTESALRRDRMLLEFLRDRENNPQVRGAEPLLSIDGLGYFETDPVVAGKRSAALSSLQREITRSLGPDFLAKRREKVDRDLLALLREDPASAPIASPTSVEDQPPFTRFYSSRWVDLRAGRAALDVLEDARPLDAAAHHAPAGDAFELVEDEVVALRRYAAKLAGQLVEVANSRREDWGQTLLVGMARLSALKESIASGRLVFLDSFPDEGHAVVPPRRGGFASQALAENERRFEASRAHFLASADPDELAWERVEETGNRYIEMRRSQQSGEPIRVARGHLVPSRAAPYPIAMLPPREDLAASAKRAKEKERTYARDMRRIHRYGLITQNCATAIFDTLNASFGGSVELSEQELGGYVSGTNSLAFVPFVSAQQVKDHYRVARQETVLSYRQQRLRDMRQQEKSLWVELRESNTFSAKSYQRNPDDSFFVFFTDEAPLLRPIFGAVNLVAAVGETALGIATAPVDRGAVLIRGLRGAFVSLPELVFANIRKGSNGWIPKEHRNLAPVLVAEHATDTHR